MKARDRSYYIRRAEAELALAQSAAHPAAMRAHYHLAGYYLDKVYRPIDFATALGGTSAGSRSGERFARFDAHMGVL